MRAAFVSENSRIAFRAFASVYGDCPEKRRRVNQHQGLNSPTIQARVTSVSHVRRTAVRTNTVTGWLLLIEPQRPRCSAYVVIVVKPRLRVPGGRRSHPDELLRAHLSDSRPGSSGALMLSMLDTATCIHPSTSSIYFSSRSSLPATTVKITP